MFKKSAIASIALLLLAASAPASAGWFIGGDVHIFPAAREKVHMFGFGIESGIIFRYGIEASLELNQLNGAPKYGRSTLEYSNGRYVADTAWTPSLRSGAGVFLNLGHSSELPRGFSVGYGLSLGIQLAAGESFTGHRFDIDGVTNYDVQYYYDLYFFGPRIRLRYGVAEFTYRGLIGVRDVLDDRTAYLNQFSLGVDFRFGKR